MTYKRIMAYALVLLVCTGALAGCIHSEREVKEVREAPPPNSSVVVTPPPSGGVVVTPQ